MMDKKPFDELMTVVKNPETNEQAKSIAEVREPSQGYEVRRNGFDFDAEWEKALTTEQLIQELFDHIDTLPWND